MRKLPSLILLLMMIERRFASSLEESFFLILEIIIISLVYYVIISFQTLYPANNFSMTRYKFGLDKSYKHTLPIYNFQ